jgi:hypothetical protein
MSRRCVISRVSAVGRGLIREYLRLEGVFQYPHWNEEPNTATVLPHATACLWADALKSKEGRPLAWQPQVHFVN